MNATERFSNPLLTTMEIHPDLKPLFDALVQVSVWTGAIAGCYPALQAMLEASGQPKPYEWPGSKAYERHRARLAEIIEAERNAAAEHGDNVMVADAVDSRWTDLIREFSDFYMQSCSAIATARRLAQSPAVAAIMDATDVSPALRWTMQVVKELDRLASTIHPIQIGGADGFGFIRAGLPPLSEAFFEGAASVEERIAELRSIPLNALAAAPGVCSEDIDRLEDVITDIPKALDAHLEVLHQIDAGIEALGEPEPDDPSPMVLPKLGPHDREAWQLSCIAGMKQGRIAKVLNEKYGTSYKQPWVSKAIRRAMFHVEASGLEEKMNRSSQRTIGMEPRKLEIGPRIDKRAPRPSDLNKAEEDFE